MIYDKLIEKVDNGRLGLNVGLPTGLPRLDEYLGGLQKETYYLLGSVSGVGKTALADHMFIHNPYEFILKNPQFDFKVFYWSLEISKERKLAKWVCLKMYRDLNIICSLKEVLSLQKNRLSDEKYQIVKSYKDYFENMFDKIEIYDTPINPTGIYKSIRDFYESNGTWEEKIIIRKGKQQKMKVYVANNPNLYVVSIIDHYGLLKRERARGEDGEDGKHKGGNLYTKKENIDKMDEYNVELRNKYGLSPIMISQFNRELSDINRQRFKELMPQLEDFKDTGNVSESANIVIAPFHPKRYNINKYLGYELTGSVSYNEKYNISDYFRAIFILKNRDDLDGISIATKFLGQCGYFEELSLVEEFEREKRLYLTVSQF